jgi:hypothetical protein
VAKLEIRSTRPWLTLNALTYFLDPPPRFVVNGREYEGSWRRDHPLVLDVESGDTHVEAYRDRAHPLSRYLRRRGTLRRAEANVSVPAGSDRIVIEFRASHLWSLPGKIRLNQVGA